MNVSTFAFNATKSLASTVASFVSNVIISLAFTFVIASSVAFTAPVAIVALTTPVVNPAIVFTSAAVDVPDTVILPLCPSTPFSAKRISAAVPVNAVSVGILIASVVAAFIFTN